MFDVFLYIYDLSFGAARTLGSLLLGKHIDGIWHTGVVVHNKEYFYGSHGISYCPPGGTVLREPEKKLYMGQTSITESELSRYLENLACTTFRGGEYRLFDHNCNTFSSYLVDFLTHRHIPQYILDLPSDVASTPLGAALKPALNTLSSGLNNIPQFGLTESAGRDRNMNNHTEDDVFQMFRPILFDEPLSSDLMLHRIELLWCDANNGARNAHLVTDLFQVASGSDWASCMTPEHFDLLDFNRMDTEDQCRMILELFRLAVWKHPDLLTAMLTDPNKRLHSVAQARFPTSQPDETLELHSALAKLLCNCIGLSSDWPVNEDNELRFHLDPIMHICLLLLGHDDHCLDHSGYTLMPAHRQVGLALAHNLSLCRYLTSDEALEMGTYLIHLAVTQNKSYKQPIEAIYLLRAIYFLVVRFSIVADFARACDLSGCLTAVMNEATDPDNTTVYRVEPIEAVGAVPFQPPASDGFTSMDYLIVTRLLDYLTSAQ